MEPEILVSGIQVDAQALKSVAHHCDPALCAKGQCCCDAYDIELTHSDRERVTQWFSDAASYSDRLPPDADLDMLLRRVPGVSGYLMKTVQGGCAFAYRQPDTGIRCALHTAALRAGAAPYRVKPYGCALWPLTLSSGKPPILSVQPDAFKFPCNRHRDPDTPGLDDGVVDTLRECLGETFLKSLLEQIA